MCVLPQHPESNAHPLISSKIEEVIILQDTELRSALSQRAAQLSALDASELEPIAEEAALAAQLQSALDGRYSMSQKGSTGSAAAGGSLAAEPEGHSKKAAPILALTGP